ncbi:MAG: DUF5615 family PIN-like protein [Gemmataceae bacterium]
MKLLLDQGLPRSAAQHLRDAGHDVKHVGEIGLAHATDATILDAACTDHRWIVTLDADFHLLLAKANASTPSVIRIRQEGLKGAEVAALVHEVVVRCGGELARGALVSVIPPYIRVKLLPLVKGATVP